MTGIEIAAAIGAVASVASTVGGLISAGQQSSVSSYNQQVALEDADAARKAAKTEADDIRRKGAREQSRLRAATGATGLIAEEGSPYELLLDNAAEIELDAQRRLFRGETEAKRFERQAALEGLTRPDPNMSYLKAGAGLLEAGGKAWSILDSGRPKTSNSSSVPRGEG